MLVGGVRGRVRFELSMRVRIEGSWCVEANQESLQ